jgi:hypothetical protein
MVAKMEESHVQDVVRIHIDLFPDAFLTNLGPSFLTLLYKHMCERGFGYVCIEDNSVIGFLSGIYCTTEAFYKDIIKQSALYLSFLLITTMLRKPGVILPILRRGSRLLRNGGRPQVDATPEYWELLQSQGTIVTALTAATDLQSRRKGVYTQLWARLLQDESRPGGSAAVIFTAQGTNDMQNNFCKKMGYKIIARVRRGYGPEEIRWLTYWRGHSTVDDTGHVVWN